MRRALLCAALVVLAGCAVPAADPDSEPGTDRLGWESGYWYDDPVAVNATDGLNESERGAVLARQMARIEHVRNLEFEEPVELRVITREEYRRNRSRGSDETHAQWNNQVWEALFLVGEDTSVEEEFNSTLGSSVLGYYRAGSDEVVIVSDRDDPMVDRGTLVHELVHALQDQQFGLGEVPDTQDRQLARNSVVEGEATLLESRYEQQCGGEWDCIETPPRAGTGGGNVNRGVLLVILAPYVQGPDFITAVQRRGGWRAVNDLHREYPASTEQVLDPETLPDETPVEVTVTDRSNDEWRRFDHDPVADTVGQASIHATFFQNGIRAADIERYSYAHPAAVDWEGDTLVPYRNGDRFGYVWETAWESEAEAHQFAETYRALLESEGATLRDGGVAVVPGPSPFEDAFRVTRDGTRVRVVNAPTVEELPTVHAR
jgi:hypothetical protein